MARLSNFFAASNPGDSDEPIVCRVADRSRGEIEAGLRLILGSAAGPADDETVLDFLSLAVQRRIDVNLTWVAQAGARIVWALLPVPGAGRTMLLMSPGRLPRRAPVQSIRLLADAVCAHHSRQSTDLAQILLDPRERTVRALYANAGFTELAELVYLQRRVDGLRGNAVSPKTGSVLTYDQQTHPLFADLIERSYEGSRDCPALNGREIEDVIAGHKATGLFDPSLWLVVVENGIGRGVLLLNPMVVGEGVELVYLGVPPQSRGKGMGDCLMRLALMEVGRRGLHGISLAVDSRNKPALSLYLRHGLKKVGFRAAMLRDLRFDEGCGSHPQRIPKVP